MADLYKHIEELAMAHGYKTITDLCRAAGIPRTTMSELNKRRSKTLSQPTAKKIADALDVSIDEVYGAEPKDDQQELIAMLQKMRDIDRVLLQASSKMRVEEVEKIVELLNTFKGNNMG